MFALSLADGLRCVWFIYPILSWRLCPERRNSSIVWAQLSRFHLKTETESNLRNKNRSMDNVQKQNNSINTLSSQTFRSYL
jgi:hypothetical protein